MIEGLPGYGKTVGTRNNFTVNMSREMFRYLILSPNIDLYQDYYISKVIKHFKSQGRGKNLISLDTKRMILRLCYGLKASSQELGRLLDFDYFSHYYEVKFYFDSLDIQNARSVAQTDVEIEVLEILEKTELSYSVGYMSIAGAGRDLSYFVESSFKKLDVIIVDDYNRGTSPRLVEKFINFAQEHKKKILILIGDTENYEQSRYFNLNDQNIFLRVFNISLY